ncbi:MAG: Fe-S cluster assembly protein SufD [Planctomycetes bacterium]|nr:Fe-S cluster assembly protein SufD [Planctomycetota bacterium]
MLQVAQKTDDYLSRFAQLEARLAGDGAALLLPIRKKAIERFAQLGFPTTRDEDWRFTNVAPIARTAFGAATRDGEAVEAQQLATSALMQADWPRLVFVNGHVAPQLSSVGELSGGVRLESLAAVAHADPEALQQHLARHADYQDHPFTALNTAFMEDGAYVHIPKGVYLEQPIHLVFVSTADAGPVVSHPRNLIVAENGSQATIIESYLGLGDGVYFTNAVTEIVVGENAVIDHYKVGREAQQAYHVGTTQIHQDRSSNASSHAITIGGALVRNDINTVLDGEGAQCTLNGLYLVSGRQHVDNHLRVEHAKPHCDSREFFKGVLDGHGKAVFTGRIIVRKDAQKTDAKQTNMNLLLSDHAQVDTKPQLEIFANDVKCTHGATIGQIDENAMFYLRSRGLSEPAARGLLVYAFASEAIDRIQPQLLRSQLRQRLFDWLPEGHRLQDAQ